jgi:2-iminobutanoate/2-iminopropanoate deaminase
MTTENAMTRTTSTAAGLPRPAGPYSHVAGSGGVWFASGQAGADSEGRLASGIAAQSQQCFANLLAAAGAAGATEQDVVKVTVYLTDVADFAAMNEAYAATFSSPYPARTTVYVTLPPGMLIEADVVAITAAKELAE